MQKMHIQRLNHLLSSNNLSQIQTKPDRDCFFNAICCQISTENYTSSELRSKVCEHLLENEQHYINFLYFSNELSIEDRSKEYVEIVHGIMMPQI